MFKLLIIQYLFLYSFNTYLLSTSLYQAWCQAAPSSPIPKTFAKVVRICFVFHEWYGSKERSARGSGQCAFVRDSHKCVPNLGCSKGKRGIMKKCLPTVLSYEPQWHEKPGWGQTKTNHSQGPPPPCTTHRLCARVLDLL